MLTLAGSGELLTAGALLDSGDSPRATGLGFSPLPPPQLAARAALDPAVEAGVERARVVTYRLPKGSISFPSAQQKAQSRRLYEEVFGRGNVGVADEIMAPDIVSHGPGAPPVIGTDQIKAQAMRLRTAIPDLMTILGRQIAEGDMVTSYWTGKGTHTGEMSLPSGGVAPTGKPISFDEIRIDRYSDGRIVESWFIPDRFTLWTQMGMLPAPNR
jgi:predicted ester cyclase